MHLANNLLFLIFLSFCSFALFSEQPKKSRPGLDELDAHAARVIAGYIKCEQDERAYQNKCAVIRALIKQPYTERSKGEGHAYAGEEGVFWVQHSIENFESENETYELYMHLDADQLDRVPQQKELLVVQVRDRVHQLASEAKKVTVDISPCGRCQFAETLAGEHYRCRFKFDKKTYGAVKEACEKEVDEKMRGIQLPFRDY